MYCIRRTTYNINTVFYRKKCSLSTANEDKPIKIKNPFSGETKRCILCGVPVDYKNIQLLSQFVSSMTGRQFPQKSTNLCSMKFQEVSNAIKIGRNAGFLPYTSKESLFLDDPVLVARNLDNMVHYIGVTDTK